ncbi:hypothetical protein FN846DRAFT_1013406 [Sphaerosporella brunnea]|uniref:Uncharacterized protein n=1 Tax=Sphaerosporella brunnea TaxID=1250544 RepID=A0A5J5EY17_9PEZI|nr:hypothetical protein FN846DRAFT_1013406 [Sphaerosporella brunnea]
MALVLPEEWVCLTLYTSRRVRLVIDVSDSRFFNWELLARSQDTLQLRALPQSASASRQGRGKSCWQDEELLGGLPVGDRGFGEFPFWPDPGKPWAGLVVEARGVGGERAVGEFVAPRWNAPSGLLEAKTIAIRTDPEPTEWRKPPATLHRLLRDSAKPPQGALKKLSLAEYSALQRSKANAKSKVNPLQPPPAVNSEGNDDSKMQPSRQAYPPNKLAQPVTGSPLNN